MAVAANAARRARSRYRARRPAAIGIDIVMPEPDRLSPEHLLRSARRDDPILARRLDALPSNDSVLAQRTCCRAGRAGIRGHARGDRRRAGGTAVPRRRSRPRRKRDDWRRDEHPALRRSADEHRASSTVLPADMASCPRARAMTSSGARRSWCASAIDLSRRSPRKCCASRWARRTSVFMLCGPTSKASASGRSRCPHRRTVRFACITRSGMGAAMYPLSMCWRAASIRRV